HARGLTGTFAEVIKLRTAHAAFARDFHLLDARRVQRENALDAFAKGHAAHGEARIGALAAFAPDDDAFKDLHAFLLAFNDAEVDAHGVPDGKFWNHVRRLLLCLPQFFKRIHDSTSFSGPASSCSISFRSARSFSPHAPSRSGRRSLVIRRASL